MPPSNVHPRDVVSIASQDFPGKKNLRVNVNMAGGEVRLDIRVWHDGYPTRKGLVFDLPMLEDLKKVIDWAEPLMRPYAEPQYNLQNSVDLSHLVEGIKPIDPQRRKGKIT